MQSMNHIQTGSDINPVSYPQGAGKYIPAGKAAVYELTSSIYCQG
jgi:hypothetical protein